MVTVNPEGIYCFGSLPDRSSVSLLFSGNSDIISYDLISVNYFFRKKRKTFLTDIYKFVNVLFLFRSAVFYLNTLFL